MEFDHPWCPVCDRQIPPKRRCIPVYAAPEPQEELPPPPPPSSQVDEAEDSSDTCKSFAPFKHFHILILSLAKAAMKKRLNNNFVVGGGKGRKGLKGQAAAGSSKPKVLYYRNFLENDPKQLYCSDECERTDLNHPKKVERKSCEAESVSSTTPTTSTCSRKWSPSLITLASIYKFTPPLCDPVTAEDVRTISHTDLPHDYNSGVMMAAKRLEAYLTKPTKRSPYDFSIQPTTRPTVPGFNDGSHEWRKAAYNLGSVKSDPLPCVTSAAYKSMPSRAGRHVPTAVPQVKIDAPAEEEMAIKFANSVGRSRDSRLASTAPRKERSIVKPGAEGRLLVPDVKLKLNRSSSSSAPLAPKVETVAKPVEAVPVPNRRPGTQGMFSLFSGRRPFTYISPVRSWSYDNMKTYPIYSMPKKMEKRMETRVENGAEIQVEVVEEEEPKCLFYFPVPWNESQRTRPAHDYRD